MHKMKRRFSRVLSVILMIVMLANTSMMTYATEANGQNTESNTITNPADDFSITENIIDEGDMPTSGVEMSNENEAGSDSSSETEKEKSLDQIENLDESNADETVLEETLEQVEISEEATNQDLIKEEFFYRNLESEEIEEKERLFTDTTVIADVKEEEDFVKNEVIYLCDTKEDAENAAKAYAEATGYTVKVNSFSYGVAVLGISGSPKKNDGYSSINSVQRVINYAADMTNNLPAVYPNYIRQAHTVNTTYESFSDPFLRTESEMFQWYHEMINDKPLFERQDSASISLDLSNITVAVLDTGIDSSHNDFFSSGISSSNMTSDAVSDKNGHGTNVAGIIGAVANTIGGRGVASGIKINAIKVLGDNGQETDDAVLRGLKTLYGKRNGNPEKTSSTPQVVNMSLGGAPYSSAYLGVISDLHDLGVTIVASAGNESSGVLSFPAAYEHVISVAALNSNYEKAQYSNYGAWVDISAPGGDCRVSNGSVMEEFIWSTGSTNHNGGEYREDKAGRIYSGMYGTSQAAPIVSAAAALLYAQNKNITPNQVEARLKSSASPVKGSYQLGAGCVNIAASLGIDELVPQPVVSGIEGNTIEAGVSSLAFAPIPNATIYYTLDGKNPDITKALEGEPASGTYIHNWKNPLVLRGTGKVVVKAITLLYGKTSPVSTFTYTYGDTLVNDIKLTTLNGIHNVGIGKKLAIQADVLPVYAKNRKITWRSSNTSIAVVDGNGVVTAVSEGEAGDNGEVTIYASSTDGSNIEGEFTICVKPLVNLLTVPVSKITLDKGEVCKLIDSNSYTEDTSGGYPIVVYPNTASHEFTFTSSKPSVATIDDEGNITAKSSGSATITTASTDGSGKKDTIIVEVKTPVKKIDITGSNGFDKVAVGSTIMPKVVFNDGASKPDNINLKWTCQYTGQGTVQVDEQTGKLTVSSSVPIGKTITVNVSALDGSGISAVWKVLTYPMTTYLSANYWAIYGINVPTATKDNVWNIIGDNSIPALQVQPANSMKEFSYKSSNPKVIKINSQGDFEVLGKGKSKITITALDGSNKSITVDLYGYDYHELGVESPEPHNVLYPGKSITFKESRPSNNNSPITICLLDNEYYPYFSNEYITLSNLKVTCKKDIAKYGNESVYQEVFPIFFDFWDWEWKYLPPTMVEIYPSAVNSIKVEGPSQPLELDSDPIQLGVTVLPENACQKYLTFTSSNPKVVTVDANGKVSPVSNGKATITVTAGDGSKKKATCTVTVAQKARSLEVKSKNDLYDVASGKSLQLVATVDANAANKKVKYKSENETIATVNASGKVTAKSVKTKQKVDIVATTDDGNQEVITPINVYPATTAVKAYEKSDTLRKTPLTEVKLAVDASLKLPTSVNVSAYAFPYEDGGTGNAFSYMQITSSNPSIASVEYNPEEDVHNAKINAVGVGTANIKFAQLDGSGKSTTLKVTVLAPVREIKIAPKSNVKTLVPGKSLQLVATTNADASNKNVEWSISAGYENLATIDQTGKITLTTNTGSLVNKETIPVIAKAMDGSNCSKQYLVPYQSYVTDKIVLLEGEKEVNTVNMCLGGKPVEDSPLIATNESSYEDICIMPYAKENKISTECTVSSSNTAVVQATYKETGDKACVSLKAGTKAGTATITVMATDGSGKKASFKVNVIDPVRKIAVKSATDGYYMARGTSLSMKAVTNTNATNKKVTWSLENEMFGVSIDANGNLKASANAATGTVYVMATATDGSSVKSVKAVNIRPASSIAVMSSHVSLSISNNEMATVIFSPYNISSGAYAEYAVTYTTGNAKVYYSPEHSDSMCTAVKVIPIKKGRVTITATTQDGTKKSIKWFIDIVD